METQKFIYYEDEGIFIGWLEDYPDYRTQGKSLEGLIENLRDLYHDLTGNNAPSIRMVGELQAP